MMIKNNTLLKYHIKIDNFDPISLWDMYGRRNNGGSYLKPKAKILKKQIELLIMQQNTDKSLNNLDIIAILEINYLLKIDKMYFKNGKMRKWDIDNQEKLIIDGIFDGLKHLNNKIDDSLLVKKTTEKKLSNNDINSLIIDLEIIKDLNKSLP